jgi:hypothetical protein
MEAVHDLIAPITGGMSMWMEVWSEPGLVLFQLNRRPVSIRLPSVGWTVHLSIALVSAPVLVGS